MLCVWQLLTWMATQQHVGLPTSALWHRNSRSTIPDRRINHTSIPERWINHICIPDTCILSQTCQQVVMGQCTGVSGIHIPVKFVTRLVMGRFTEVHSTVQAVWISQVDRASIANSTLTKADSRMMSTSQWNLRTCHTIRLFHSSRCHSNITQNTAVSIRASQNVATTISSLIIIQSWSPSPARRNPTWIVDSPVQLRHTSSSVDPRIQPATNLHCIHRRTWQSLQGTIGLDHSHTSYHSTCCCTKMWCPSQRRSTEPCLTHKNVKIIRISTSEQTHNIRWQPYSASSMGLI